MVLVNIFQGFSILGKFWNRKKATKEYELHIFPMCVIFMSVSLSKRSSAVVYNVDTGHEAEIRCLDPCIVVISLDCISKILNSAVHQPARINSSKLNSFYFFGG